MKCSVSDCADSAVSFTAGKCAYHMYAEEMGYEAADRQRALAEKIMPPAKQASRKKRRAAAAKRSGRS